MYTLVKYWARLALRFYCSRIVIKRKEAFISGVPEILACNHPNSFLDAIIIGAHHPAPVHFLARGDAFKKPWVARLLRGLQMIPVYRLSEGKENLQFNEQSFSACIEVLKNKGSVLIFSEGICKNEWRIRPLKKGTARLAHRAWSSEDTAATKLQPVGMSYSSFTTVPKGVLMQYATPLVNTSFTAEDPAVFYQQLNAGLSESLTNSIITKEDVEDIKAEQGKPGTDVWRYLLAVPALLGFITQRWFYVLWRNFAQRKTSGTVFYDSVLFACLMLTYPVFVLLLTSVMVMITGSHWCWLLLGGLPLTALAYRAYKTPRVTSPYLMPAS